MDAGNDAALADAATDDAERADATGPIRVACGSIVCESARPSGGLTEIAPLACCVSPGVCGVTNAALFGEDGACFPSTQEDHFATSQCPTEALDALPVLPAFAGCCRSDMRCGVHVTLLDHDLGCLERGEVSAAFTAGGHGPVAWTAMSCSEYPPMDASIDGAADSGNDDDSGGAGNGGFGGVGGGGGDAGETLTLIGACNFALIQQCQEFWGPEAQRAALQQECSQASNTWLDSCPDTNIKSECRYAHGPANNGVEGRTYSYPGQYTVQNTLRSACEQGLQGTFTWFE